MTGNQVVLVDQNDNEIGVMEKLEAHQKGLLHRAISIFIFNKNNQLLLQRRAFDKYHSGGLWTNTCCSHPYPNEMVLDAANRRLEEEMGLNTPLFKAFSFIYKSSLDNNLTEYELDHIFIGFSDQTPHLNLEEASSFKWLTLEEIKQEISLFPEHYTSWFKILMDEHIEKFFELVQNESLQKSEF